MGRKVVGLIIALCAMCLLAPARLQAQDGSAAFGLAYLGVGVGALMRLLESDVTLRRGDEIRVRRWREGDVRGVLQRVTADSLFVRVGDSTTALPQLDLRRVQRYDGLERKWAQGFGYGFLIGAGSGAVLGMLSGNDPPADEFSFTAEQKALILGVVGAFTGSCVGAVAGAFKVGEHWRGTHPLQASLAVTPARSGATIGVRLSY